MKILLLAPEPFYQDRGTPIAVNLLLRVLSQRGYEIDVVTYHEGRSVAFRHVMLHRIVALPFMHNIRPGFTWKKIICDCLLFYKALRLVPKKQYDVIYAVEESVFMALAIHWMFSIPYIYDMDSSLAGQMLEKYPILRPVTFLLRAFEHLAVRHAMGVAPVCEALAALILTAKPRKVVVLHDTWMSTASQENDLEANGPTFDSYSPVRLNNQ